MIKGYQRGRGGGMELADECLPRGCAEPAFSAERAIVTGKPCDPYLERDVGSGMNSGRLSDCNFNIKNPDDVVCIIWENPQQAKTIPCLSQLPRPSRG